MRSNFYRRLGSVFCAIAAMLWFSAAFFITSAATGNGGLNIVCKSGDEPIYGMHFSIYHVGSLISDDKIKLEGDFADCPVYIPDFTVSSLQDAAGTLENFAILDGMKPVADAISDVNGNLSFNELSDGVYLVSGDKLSVGAKIYTPTPMLVEIHDSNIITANAKFTVHDKPSFSEQLYRVKKVWQFDDSSIQLRPAEIDVAIYCDNEYVQTVTLNKANDWTYQWSGDALSTWRVKELNIPGEYKVVYRNNETQFLIINSRDVLYNTTTSTTTTTTTSTTTTTTTVTDTVTTTSETSTETTTTTTETTTSNTGTSNSTIVTTTVTGGGKLPQTGQLWWPVPVCGLAGIVLFVAGWRINKSK